MTHQPKPNNPTGAVIRASVTPAKKVTERKTTESTVKPKLITVIIVGLFFAVALFLRAYLPYNQVFTSEGIKFTSNDSYFFMRMVDNIIYNFPNHTQIDPYLLYPGASGPVGVNFFVWLITVLAWIIGLGSPNQHTIDVVAVYLPAVMGALTVIPVYFIGKELSGRWAGMLAAGLIAILPGEFLGRSILGFTDNHVAETLFTIVTMLFLILAVKTASQCHLTFNHLKNRDWATIRKPLIYSLLASFFMGIYIFTWLGALLFVFITFLFFVIQFIIDHLKHKSTDYLCFVGVIFFFVTLLMSLISSDRLYQASLVIATLAMLVLNALSRLMASRKKEEVDRLGSKSADYICLAGVILIFVVLFVLMLEGRNTDFAIMALLIIPVMSVIYELIANKKIKPVYYPLALLGLAGVGVGYLYLIERGLFNSMLSAFSLFKPTGASLTTVEMQPLISPIYGNLLAIVWGNFNISFFLSFITLAILTYLIIKQGSAEKSLLLVWSLVILVAALGQRRFGYYLAVNVALLTGYLSWKVIELFGVRLLFVSPFLVVGTTEGEGVRRARAGRRARQRMGSVPIFTTYFVAVMKLMVVLLIIFVVFAPNILLPSFKESPAYAVASSAPYAPSDAWVSSLTWLKDNSPEPLGSPDAYYQIHQVQIQQLPPVGDPYIYPASAYGVLAWWDYGYWISRIAHRIPNVNPSQDPKPIFNVASFFTSQNETAASEIRQKLGSAYIVIDHETTLSKFWAIVTWAGKDQFFDSYLVQQQGQPLRQVILYYPEYYRSMAVRMFNFDGKAVTPENTIVISSQEQKDNAGNVFKLVTDVKQYPTYQEAEDFLLSQQSGNYRIIGSHPLKSPVPLEALEHYRLIRSSDNYTVSLQDETTLPSVKIFEYVK